MPFDGSEFERQNDPRPPYFRDIRVAEVIFVTFVAMDLAARGVSAVDGFPACSLPHACTFSVSANLTGVGILALLLGGYFWARIRWIISHEFE